MISQNSNNQPNGTAAKQCNTGTPIMGRTDPQGSLILLKVKDDGTLVATNGNDQPANYLLNTNPINCATGALATNTLIAQTSLAFSQGGLYRINPAFIFDGATSGGISFLIIKEFTAMYNYVQSLPDGSPFSPTMAEVAPNGGITGYIHNSSVQTLGGNLEISYNRNNAIDVFMEGGQYIVAIISDGVINISTPVAAFGCFEFTKLS